MAGCGAQQPWILLPITSAESLESVQSTSEYYIQAALSSIRPYSA